MKTNLIFKPFICGLIISSMLSATLISADAASYSSGAKTVYTANGITYNGYNTIYTGSNYKNQRYAMAMTNAASKDHSTLSGGWAGVQPILYNASGTAIATGEWSYNSSGSSGIGASVDYVGFTSSTAYYAQGYTRAWNGSDYWTYTTSKSPNLNDYTA
jgi:hypothetical protein